MIAGNVDGNMKTNKRNTKPIAKLVNGPTTAIIISLLGVSGSFSIFETPPNIYNSISVTINPYFWATNECANSCNKIDTMMIIPLVIPTRNNSIKVGVDTILI